MTARFSPLAFWLLVLPFAANDIGLILANDVAGWLTVDYGSKLLVIAAILGTPTLRRSFLDRCVASVSWLRFGMAALVVSVVSIAVLEGLDRTGLDGWTALQSFYPIEQSGLLVFDLTFGLLLTAVTEEAVFRGAFLD